MTTQSDRFREWLTELNMDPDVHSDQAIMTAGTVAAMDRHHKREATDSETLGFIGYLIGYTGADR